MTTRIPGLAFEIDGDLIRLEQSTDGGAVAMIELHHLHLRHLAEAAGLLAPVPLPAVPLGLPEGTDGMSEISVLRDADSGNLTLLQVRMEGMGGTDAEIDLHPMQALWLAAKLAALVGCNENSEEISVTQPGRGRPSTGQAMTNAERQARHRAKQADLLPAEEVSQ